MGKSEVTPLTEAQRARIKTWLAYVGWSTYPPSGDVAALLTAHDALLARVEELAEEKNQTIRGRDAIARELVEHAKALNAAFGSAALDLQEMPTAILALRQRALAAEARETALREALIECRAVVARSRASVATAWAIHEHVRMTLGHIDAISAALATPPQPPTPDGAGGE